MKAADLKEHPPKIIIYSRPGLGKTALAMTLGEDCLYLDMDDNLDVAFGLHDQFREQRLSVEVEQFLETNPNVANAFNNFKNRLVKIVNECTRGTFPYKAIVLDSLTSLAAGAQDMVMGNNSKLGQNPQIQHWGSILNEIERVVVKLRALPVFVFVLAHEMTFTSEDSSTVQIAIPGQKLPGRITRMFNEIWYLRAKPLGGNKFEYYIQTVPTTSITCRSGRGLKTGTVFASVDKEGNPTGSVGMWDIVQKIYDLKKEDINQPTTTK